MNREIRLYSADWVLPVTAEPIKNGAVAIDDSGVIIDAGSVDELVKKHEISKENIKYYKNSVIMPSLINAHTHLYYSAFKKFMPETGSYIEWLEALVSLKEKMDREYIAEKITTEAERMFDRGVSLIGNICTEMMWDAEVVAKTSLKGINFLEVIGFDPSKADEITAMLPPHERLKELENFGFKTVPAPHSLYSCSPKLIKKIMKKSAELSIPSTIHLAESKEESEFLLRRAGVISAFLKNRDAYYDSWKPPGMSPSKYLESIGGLQSGLLAVHSVHLNKSDAELLAKNNVNIVTCPGSNRYLGVGKAPLEMYLQNGINICIGTDSPASNERMDIFNEMKIIKDEYPSISSLQIIRMATINGAKALRLDHLYGSIEKGKSADLIVLKTIDDIINQYNIKEKLIEKIDSSKVERIEL